MIRALQRQASHDFVQAFLKAAIQMQFSRRTSMTAASALVACGIFGLEPAIAATPAEAFIATNIARGLTILANPQLTQDQRQAQFAAFLLTVTDMRRIALFTLGQYAQTASPAQTDAFVASFQRYAVATYQTYFAQYSGQTLQIIGTTARSPDDYIVKTNMIDSHANGQQPLEIDFRVRTDGGKPVIVDFSVAGVWLVLEERDQFAGILSKNKGDLSALASALDQMASRPAQK